MFLRVGLLVVIGWIGHPFGLLWLGLPIVAAVLVSQKGGQRYLDENGPTLTRAFNRILDLVAYLALLTDELPSRAEHPVRLQIEGLVRWEARLLAYLASLVNRYPPFMLETASVSSAAPSSSP